MAPFDSIPSVSIAHGTRPTSAPVARSAVLYRPRPEAAKEKQESKELALEAQDWKSTERERAELRLLVENDDRFGYAMDCAKKSIEKSAGITLNAFAPLADLVWRVLCILWDVEASRFVPKARLRTIIERLREELKNERRALEDSRRTYFKELVSHRERCRNLDPALVSHIDEVVYEDAAVMYYEPLDYLDENTREHVAEIVEEKLKLILTKQASLLDPEKFKGQTVANPEEMDKLQEKLTSSERDVERLRKQLRQTQEEFQDLQNHLMTITKKAAEQKKNLEDEKNHELQRAEAEKAALKAKMEEDKKRAEEQLQQAESARKRTSLLEQQIADIQKSADADSAAAKQKLEKIQQERLEEQEQAERLEKESAEIQKDAEAKEKRLSVSERRWSTLRGSVFEKLKKKKEAQDGWKSALGLFSAVTDHTKDFKEKVAAKEHEISVLKREVKYLIDEIASVMDLQETDKGNVIRCSDRRVMTWMAGEEVDDSAAQPEGWGRLRSSILDLARKSRMSLLGLAGETSEDGEHWQDESRRRSTQIQPADHTECNAEIDRLKSEIEKLKETIDRLMVELAAATGSNDMDALRNKLGDRLDWVFQRPKGNVFQRLYDDAFARERRNALLRSRFAEMRQEIIIEDTLRKHHVPESIGALLDANSTMVHDESISVFGFTTANESSINTSSLKNPLPHSASPPPKNANLSNDPGRRGVWCTVSGASDQHPRPASVALPKPPAVVSQDLRSDGVRPSELYRLSTWEPRSTGAARRRPSSATARRLVAEREYGKQRPSSAASRKSVGSRVTALSGARSLPGLLS